MAKNIVNQKQITQLIAEKRRIKLKDTSILTADVNHIIVKDIVELYLKLNFCKRINWVDHNGNELKTSNIFKNITQIISNFISISSVKKSIIKMLDEEQKQGNKSNTTNNQELKIQYIRTDHWFNLKSGGSVGHTSGVINSFIKKGVLNSILSSSKLYNVNWKSHYLLAEPNYLNCGNVPNLPELVYNKTLISNYFTSTREVDFNTIYQRYSLGNFFGVYLRRKYNLPLILEFNGSELWVSKNWNNKKIFFYDILKKIESLNLKFADKIIVVSEVLKSNLITQGIDANKILVNPNGVDVDVYKPKSGGDQLKKSLGIGNKQIVGFIGTFGAWHGGIVMAKAIVLYFKSNSNTNTHFLLIGEGNDLPEVKQIIKDSGVEDGVTFTGRIDQTDGPKYLDACDVLLSPHIPNPDGSEFFGSPTKLFEYMAMEKAIIASDLNQIGEILEHKKTAILVEPNNAEALAEAIHTLILNEELQQQLGINARQEVIYNYSWDKHVEKTLNFVTKK